MYVLFLYRPLFEKDFISTLSAIWLTNFKTKRWLYEDARDQRAIYRDCTISWQQLYKLQNALWYDVPLGWGVKLGFCLKQDTWCKTKAMIGAIVWIVCRCFLKLYTRGWSYIFTLIPKLILPSINSYFTGSNIYTHIYTCRYLY